MKEDRGTRETGQTLLQTQTCLCLVLHYDDVRLGFNSDAAVHGGNRVGQSVPDIVSLSVFLMQCYLFRITLTAGRLSSSSSSTCLNASEYAAVVDNLDGDVTCRNHVANGVCVKLTNL